MKKLFSIYAVLFALVGCVNNQNYDVKSIHLIQPESTQTKVIKSEIVKIKGGKATSEETALCEKQGGQITQEGYFQYDACSVKFADGGKACQDSSECMGDCVIQEMPKKNLFNKNQAITGKCTSFNSPFGCYGLVKNGKTDGIMCVD